jgi:hypothetical protein
MEELLECALEEEQAPSSEDDNGEQENSSKRACWKKKKETRTRRRELIERVVAHNQVQRHLHEVVGLQDKLDSVADAKARQKERKIQRVAESKARQEELNSLV